MDAYPRPQLERRAWTNLSGPWEFSIDTEGVWTTVDQPPFEKRIVVPFSPETPASGVGDTGFYRACWYRRQFEMPAGQPGSRLLVHFGAVDYRTHVWVNGLTAGSHEGGY